MQLHHQEIPWAIYMQLTGSHQGHNPCAPTMHMRLMNQPPPYENVTGSPKRYLREITSDLIQVISGHV